MSTEELLVALFQTITEHLRLPDNLAWLPLAGASVATVAGLMLVLRGARWARGMAASAFFALGGVGGWYLAQQIATPIWLTTGICGVVAACLGVALFRFWQATMLAACLMAVAFSVYFVRVLTPEVANWLSPAPADGLVTLQPEGAVLGDAQPSVQAKLASLWSHLSATVPSFQFGLWSVLLSSGLAGLIFGLLLPRASQALWAATVGTVMLGVGAAGLLDQVSPNSLEWLKANRDWSLAIVGSVWGLAFILNLWSLRKRRTESADDRQPTGRSEGAVA
jgi:hypothetical protein